MAITLYGIGPSRSFRCAWALEEAALDYEFVNLEMGSDAQNGTNSAKYLDLNAQGKVPTLVHDDFVLTESAAILNYINSLSTTPFIPNDAKARARYDELCFFILAELEQPLWSNGKHRFAIPEKYRIKAMLDTATWEFDKALNALNKLVQLDEFVINNEFSFADILLAQTFNWAERFRFELPAECVAYRDRHYARDAVKRAQSKFA